MILTKGEAVILFIRLIIIDNVCDADAHLELHVCLVEVEDALKSKCFFLEEVARFIDFSAEPK